MNARTILVTGANRGLGLEFVKQILALPKPPEVLFATSRSLDSAKELQKVAEENPKVLKLLELDVNSDKSIESAASLVKTQLGGRGLNLLVNNAGRNQVGRGLNSERLTRENILAEYDTNVAGPLFTTMAFLPLLKTAASQQSPAPMSCNKAVIVNISSILGSVQLSDTGSYGYKPSKAALNMVSKCMSHELKDEGILVVSLHPGWVQTDMGGEKAPLAPQESIAGMLQVIGSLTQEQSGLLMDYKGDILPY